jgi:hypothetical protein
MKQRIFDNIVQYRTLILESGYDAGREKILLEKNINKGEFPHNILELKNLLNDEVKELNEEFNKVHTTEIMRYKDILSECGDVINYASAIAYECNKRIKE